MALRLISQCPAGPVTGFRPVRLMHSVPGHLPSTVGPQSPCHSLACPVSEGCCSRPTPGVDPRPQVLCLWALRVWTRSVVFQYFSGGGDSPSLTIDPRDRKEAVAYRAEAPRGTSENMTPGSFLSWAVGWCLPFPPGCATSHVLLYL